MVWPFAVSLFAERRYKRSSDPMLDVHLTMDAHHHAKHCLLHIIVRKARRSAFACQRLSAVGSWQLAKTLGAQYLVAAGG